MKKTFSTEEFADMVRQSDSLKPALGLLAQIYKNQMPKSATIQNNAMSCYLSGACVTLQLLRSLDLLTDDGERLAAEFVTELNDIMK